MDCGGKITAAFKTSPCLSICQCTLLSHSKTVGRTRNIRGGLWYCALRCRRFGSRKLQQLCPPDLALPALADAAMRADTDSATGSSMGDNEPDMPSDLELDEEEGSLDLAEEDGDAAWTHQHGSRLLPLPKDQDYVEVVEYDIHYFPVGRHAFRVGDAGATTEGLSAFAREKVKLLSVGSIRAFRPIPTGPWTVRLGLEKLVPRMCLSDGSTLDVWELSENLEGVGAGADQRVVLFAEVQGAVTRIGHGHALREAASHLRVGGAGSLTPVSGGITTELRLLHRACPRDISPFADGSLTALTVARPNMTGDSVKPAPGDVVQASVTWPGGEAQTLKWESGKGTVCDALELAALHAGAGENVQVFDAKDELLVSLVMPDSAAFSKHAWQDMESCCTKVDEWCAQAKELYYDGRHALAYFLWSLAVDLLKEDEGDLRARGLRSRCLSNMAACRLSRLEPAVALPLAEEACQLCPVEPSPLMWMRVAKSAEGVGESARALEAAKRAEDAPGENAEAAVKALRARARAKAATHLAEERAFCGRALACAA